MTGQVAWTLDGWVRHDQVHIALDDCGFLQGAIVVDRLRTCRGAVLDVEAHLDRFRNGCRSLGIRPLDSPSLQSIVEECAARNRNAFSGEDFSIVVLATPGRVGDAQRQPTWIVHTTPIDWRRLDHWYRSGQELEIATPRNVPAACWDPQIKTRSRLQYYLAELATTEASASSTGAVLLDLDGCLTETSQANLWIVEGKSIISPPRDRILDGISLQRTERLARDAGLGVRYDPIPVERAQAAQEVLLCGSTGCLWWASRLGETRFPPPTATGLYPRLRDLWIDDIGLDYVAQAQQRVATG